MWDTSGWVLITIIVETHDVTSHAIMHKAAFATSKLRHVLPQKFCTEPKPNDRVSLGMDTLCNFVAHDVA